MKKFYRILNSANILLFSFLLIGSLLVITLFQNSLHFICKQKFLFPIPLQLLICIFVLFIILFILFKFKNKIDNKFNKKYFLIIIVLSFLLLCYQLFFSYNAYFITSWDPYRLLCTAFSISIKDWKSLDNFYYSLYPNNVLLTWIFSVIFRFMKFLGINKFENAIFGIIIFQCVISTITGYLTFKVCYSNTKSITISFLTWLGYVLLVGISPWVFIPYSDSFGLVFPISILRIYQLSKHKKNIFLSWILMSIIAFIGYNIKPQTIIVFIAIVIYEIIGLLNADEKRVKIISLFKKAMIVCVTFILVFALNQYYIIPKTHLEIDKNKTFSSWHFIMMGLNKETNGVWYGNDIGFSGSFKNQKDRKEGNIKVIKERLSDYGTTGLIKHLSKKTLINYADGSFAWNIDGTFYKKMLDNKRFSFFYNSFFYEKGKHFKLFLTNKNVIWVFMLLVSALSILNYKKIINNKFLLIILLSIIGLTIFELMFEARARYFLTYAPFFILLANINLSYFLSYFEKLKCKNIKNVINNN